MSKRLPNTIPQVPYKKNVIPPPKIPTSRKSVIPQPPPKIPTSRKSVIHPPPPKVTKISKSNINAIPKIDEVMKNSGLKKNSKPGNKVIENSKLKKNSKPGRKVIENSKLTNIVGETKTNEIKIDLNYADNTNKKANKIANEVSMKFIKTTINKLKIKIDKLKTKKYKIPDISFKKILSGISLSAIATILYFIGYEISKSIRNGRYPCTKDDDCLTAQKEEINKWNAGTEITNLNKYTKYKCLKGEGVDGSYCTNTECYKDEECNDENLICNNRECQYKCNSNNDCDDHEICDNNICKVKCKKDNDCMKDNELEHKYFLKCLENEQNKKDKGLEVNINNCNLYCIKNKCEKKCNEQTDCNYGYKCIKNSKNQDQKYCKKITCKSDENCYENEICHNNICKEKCKENKDCKNSYIKDYSCVKEYDNDCNVFCINEKCEKKCQIDRHCDEQFFKCKNYNYYHGICKSKLKENFSQNLSKNYTINEIIIEFNKLMIDLKKKFKINK